MSDKVYTLKKRGEGGFTLIHPLNELEVGRKMSVLLMASGKVLTTSIIERIIIEDDLIEVTTANSIYLLTGVFNVKVSP